MKAFLALMLGAAVVVSGCAAHRIETPAAVPKSAPAKAPAPSRSPESAPPPAAKPRETASGEANPPVSAPPAAVAVAVAVPAPAVPKAPAGNAPSATESAYVYAPQQAAVASRSAAPSAAPPPPASAPAGEATTKSPEDTADRTPGRLQLSVIASAAEIATGAIMTVDVMASSDRAVVDAPLHLTFDPKVVEFVDGTVGDFLAQGGSSVVFFADGRTRPGDVAVAVGRVERVQGASGGGLLCRVRFRGTAAGTTPVLVGRAKAWGVHGEELQVTGGGTTAVVR